MGMYDTIEIYPVNAHELGLVCAADHPMETLQTKQLEGRFERFMIFSKHLFRERPEPVGKTMFTETVVDKQLVVTSTHRHPLHGITADVLAGEFCQRCRPVLVAERFLTGEMRVREVLPLCEFRIQIIAGRVTKVTRVRADTPDDVCMNQASHGAVVLDDDDPLAVAHWELVRRQKKRFGETEDR